MQQKGIEAVNRQRDYEAITDLQNTVRTIIFALVDNLDFVEVITTSSSNEQSKTVIISIRTAQSDIGKVIGRQGRTISALRKIMDSAGAKYRKHVIIEVSDDEPLLKKPHNKPKRERVNHC